MSETEPHSSLLPNRRLTDEPVKKTANISTCGQYRYSLVRLWTGRPLMLFVMLNPSTADANLDDPTIRRCAGFARREGLGGFSVMNLYAYRSTDPKALLTCPDPVGPQTDGLLRWALRECRDNGYPVVAAWGTNAKPGRVAQVLGLVPDVEWLCLGTTKQGHPRHPLYVKGDEPLVTFRAPLTGGSTPNPTEATDENAASRAEKLDAITRQNLDGDYL